MYFQSVFLVNNFDSLITPTRAVGSLRPRSRRREGPRRARSPSSWPFPRAPRGTRRGASPSAAPGTPSSSSARRFRRRSAARATHPAHRRSARAGGFPSRAPHRAHATASASSGARRSLCRSFAKRSSAAYTAAARVAFFVWFANHKRDRRATFRALRFSSRPESSSSKSEPGCSPPLTPSQPIRARYLSGNAFGLVLRRPRVAHAQHEVRDDVVSSARGRALRRAAQRDVRGHGQVVDDDDIRQASGYFPRRRVRVPRVAPGRARERPRAHAEGHRERRGEHAEHSQGRACCRMRRVRAEREAPRVESCSARRETSLPISYTSASARQMTARHGGDGFVARAASRRRAPLGRERRKSLSMKCLRSWWDAPRSCEHATGTPSALRDTTRESAREPENAERQVERSRGRGPVAERRALRARARESRHLRATGTRADAVSGLAGEGRVRRRVARMVVDVLSIDVVAFSRQNQITVL